MRTRWSVLEVTHLWVLPRRQIPVHLSEQTPGVWCALSASTVGRQGQGVPIMVYGVGSLPPGAPTLGSLAWRAPTWGSHVWWGTYSGLPWDEMSVLSVLSSLWGA